jgi:hypothetical protein
MKCQAFGRRVREELQLDQPLVGLDRGVHPPELLARRGTFGFFGDMSHAARAANEARENRQA